MLPKRAVHLIAPNVAHRTRAAAGQAAKTGEARSSQERCVRLEEAGCWWRVRAQRLPLEDSHGHWQRSILNIVAALSCVGAGALSQVLAVPVQ
jgi:hypothetical protein